MYVDNTRILGTGGIERMDLDESVVLMRKARMHKSCICSFSQICSFSRFASEAHACTGVQIVGVLPVKHCDSACVAKGQGAVAQQLIKLALIQTCEVTVSQSQPFVLGYVLAKQS